MTTIIACHDGSTAWLAADRQFSNGTRRTGDANKIVEAGDWAFACSGQTSIAQAIALELPPRLETVRTEAGMVLVVRNLWRVLRDDWGLIDDKDAGDIRELQVDLIVIGPPGIFDVSECRRVYQPGAFEPVACGSGGFYALGAASAESYHVRDARHMVVAGMRSAVEYDSATGDTCEMVRRAVTDPESR